jgi:drug/metabolite transporter (DMT)-like permease
MRWSVASILTRNLPLPNSKVMSSAAQMLAGGVRLTLRAALRREFHSFHPSSVSRGAWFSLLCVIVAGSIIGYTAYTWLLHHESPTKAGTYAYVNRVVAAILGYFLAGEPLGMRTILGTLFVLVSVVGSPQHKQEPSFRQSKRKRRRALASQPSLPRTSFLLQSTLCQFRCRLQRVLSFCVDVRLDADLRPIRL